ncbi:hypothetical protein [Haloprofundus halobius]|uniref:hypothetical protein n=1 Tax=Haloprofundus halobius TaxID=2876194 RepID=UPI001CCED383|nr:hypothetical protein [Haloprofundus halobius]
MCQYCNYAMEGWGELLQYDTVYQDAIERQRAANANYGFDESWDELREEFA